MTDVSNQRAPSSLIDALLFPLPASFNNWGNARSGPLTFTYRFESAQPSDLWYSYSGWTAFNDAQKSVVRAAFAELASIINVRFVETKGGDPDINLGRVNLGGEASGYGGYKYSSVNDGSTITRELDGFAVFDRAMASIPKGVILHELAHALTLKHPGSYGGSPGPYLPSAYDSNKHTVMSYNVNRDNGQASDHLMLLDIAALQDRFGANLNYRTGNDTYRGPQGLIQAIWDAGGTDTIDGSAFTSPVAIDLRAGMFSSLGARNNLAVAYGAIIERAHGGSAADQLIGNEWANLITGRGGADRISGLGGGDMIAGNEGADTISTGTGRDSIVFNTTLGAGNVDRITDFAPAYDAIRLDDAIFGGLAPGWLGSAAFRRGAVAAAGDDRIVYQPGTGALLYDADGNGLGAPIQFATLAKSLPVTAADFFVF